MTQPTLLANLYKFILGSRRVDVAALRRRFPDEFVLEQPGASRRCASRALNEALCFLLNEGVIVITPRGKLIHRSAWKEHKQLRVDRQSLRHPEVEAN